MSRAHALRRRTVPRPTRAAPLHARPPGADHRPAPGAHGTCRAPWGSEHQQHRGMHRPAAPWYAGPRASSLRPVPQPSACPRTCARDPARTPPGVPHLPPAAWTRPGSPEPAAPEAVHRRCLQLPQAPRDAFPLWRLRGSDRLREQGSPPRQGLRWACLWQRISPRLVGGDAHRCPHRGRLVSPSRVTVDQNASSGHGGQQPTLVIRTVCPQGKSVKYKQHGHRHNGKPHHHCHDCGRQCVQCVEHDLISADTRRLIERW